MSGMILVIPTLMMSMVCSALLFLLFRKTRGLERSVRIKAYGKQLAYALVLSAAISGSAILLAAGLGGLNIPAAPIFLFLWPASFFIMALFVGAFDLALPPGILVIIVCFAFGMSSAMFAYEMLPVFWQHWVYPWVPQRFMGDGIRSIIYMNAAPWNNSSLPLLLTEAIGLVMLAIATLIPARKRVDPDTKTI